MKVNRNSFFLSGGIFVVVFFAAHFFHVQSHVTSPKTSSHPEEKHLVKSGIKPSVLAAKTVLAANTQSPIVPIPESFAIQLEHVPSDLNLLSNSSFEAGNINSSPPSWNYVGQSSGGNTLVTNESIRTGNYALKFSDSTASFSHALQLGITQPNTTTINGRSYILSVFVRGFNVVGTPTLRIGFIGGNQPGYEYGGNDVHKDFPLTSGTLHDWTEFSFPYTNTALDKYPLIEILNYRGGTIYIDDAALYELKTQNSSSRNGFSNQPIYQTVDHLGDGSLIVDANGNLYPSEGGNGSLGLNGQRFSTFYGTSGDFTSTLLVGGVTTLANDVNVSGNLNATTGTTTVNNLTVNGTPTFTTLNTAGGLVYTTSTGALATSVGGVGQCLVSNGQTTPIWENCQTGSDSLFTAQNGSIFPVNATEDFLIGGQSTASAKFAFINVGSGTPTATISGSKSALVVDGNGNITTTAKQSLTLGNTSTGNIILNGGRVGIGTTSPTTQLHTTGTVRFANFGAGNLQTDSSGNVTVSSDQRLKNVLSSFDRGLSAIEQIHPVLFQWNAVSGMNQNDINAGFLAQNVQKAIPEAVGTDSRGYLTLNDRPILATLVNAVKEQELEISTTATSSALTGLQLNSVTATIAASISSNQTWQQQIQTQLTALQQQNTPTYTTLYGQSGIIGQIVQWANSVWTFFGDIVVKGKALFLQRVTFADKDMAGYAKIPSTGTSVNISFATPYAQSPVINVTPLGKYDIKFWVTNISTKGFTIQIDPPQAQDVQFNWTALAVQNAATTTGSASGGISTVTAPVAQPSPIPTIQPTPQPSLVPTPPPLINSSSTSSASLTIPSPSPTPTPSPTVSPSPSPTSQTSAAVATGSSQLITH